MIKFNKNMAESLQYSDLELYEFLRSNGKADTYENLIVLKEGLKNGTIVLEDEEEYQDITTDDSQPEDVVSQLVSDETEEKPEEKKEEVIPINASFIGGAKAFISTKNTEKLLESFLVEDCKLDKDIYEILTESAKNESVKELAIMLLKSIQEKVVEVDTTPADKSRGDIKQLKELGVLQEAITKIEELLERDENANPEYSSAVNTIIKSILYINQYSNVFKDAYRNKKTLMIMKYQSLILSIISSVTYLISSIIDFNAGTVTLKENVKNIQDFAPLKSLREFVKSVDTGEFKTMSNDVTVMREFFLELPVEKMSQILEAFEYTSVIVDGIKNIYNNLISGNTKLTNLLYRIAGIFVLLLSLRDVFYTLFRMKSKIFDMINAIQNFVGLNDGGNVLSKLLGFSNKFKNDAEFASDLTKREVEDENRNLVTKVKAIQAGNVETYSDEEPEAEPVEVTTAPAPKPVAKPAPQKAAAPDPFGFDF